MNTKYGRLAGGEIVYAPDALETEGGIKVNPSGESYLAAGWKMVVDEPPSPDEGHTVEHSAWTETADVITRVYKQVPAPATGGGEQGGGEPPPVGKRVFSKYKLVAALKAADKWVLVKTWLEEKAYYDYYLAAQNFVEDNPLFIEGRDAIKGYLGMTDAQVEAILSQCIYEP